MPTVALPLDSKQFLNVAETALKHAAAALENVVITEAKGLRRFPGLTQFAALGDQGRAYLTDWRGDLLAATSLGRLYRLDAGGTVQDVTGVPLSGGGRATFAKTEDELLIAAGGPILTWNGIQTKVLSTDAPNTTHVAFIDGYTLAIEAHSGRFYHTAPGVSTSWDALDVFTAEGKPDDLNAMLVTQFRELLMCGEDSIEQFERAQSGDRPFWRRWASGDGLYAPYTLVEADQGTWGVNKKREFVRFVGQTYQQKSDDVGAVLMAIDDWTDAWAQPLIIDGQKYIVLQAPKAANAYDTKGVTLLFDYRAKRWHALYGWDASLARPARWPGWSVHHLWGRVFVGGEGRVYEMLPGAYDHAGGTQRVLYRSAHFDAPDLAGKSAARVEIGDIRIRARRGVGPVSGTAPVMRLRLRKDNRIWTKWATKSLGLAGDNEMLIRFGNFGQASQVQVEIDMTDAAAFEIVSAWVDLEPISF
jgi:hypothetical protein